MCPAGATIELDIPVTVMDDGLVEWGALAKFTHEGSEHIERMAPAKLESKPKLFFKFESKVVQPIAGSGLLPAGDPIGLSGTVKNLTNSATLDLGPLFPELRGNAGVMRLTYDAVGGDPRTSSSPTTCNSSRARPRTSRFGSPPLGATHGPTVEWRPPAERGRR